MKKNILLTGGSHGIGATILEKLLLQENFNIIVLDKNIKVLQNFSKKFSNLNFFRCQLDNPKEVHKICQVLRRKYTDGFAGLINNAGIGGPFDLIEDVKEDDWDYIMNLNLKCPSILTRFVLPSMKKNKYGRIINIASIQGTSASPKSSTYITSKHALIGFTKAIAVEYGKYGIAANCISPGYINTQMGIQNKKINNHLNIVKKRTPTQTVGTTAEIANFVLYLLLNSSNYINGSNFIIDGGLSINLGVS